MLSSFERSCDGEEWEKEKIQGKGERRTIIYHSQEQGGDRTGDSVFDSGPCQKIHFFFSTMHMAQRRDGEGALLPGPGKVQEAKQMTRFSESDLTKSGQSTTLSPARAMTITNAY